MNPAKSRSKIKRGLLIAAGTISVGLGMIGIVLPVLPTTPFLLLAAACYAKSSDRFHNWLMNNKVFGEYIRNYMEGKGIPLKVKIMSISFLWITILTSAFLLMENWLIRILLMGIASAVTVHILSLKTKSG
ncbi:MAG: YbaN family protein [Candidatus Thermoplasmatota archaeon]|nr:YbaN family protein [Candidatus Thermoplasmatota archaeon]